MRVILMLLLLRQSPAALLIVEYDEFSDLTKIKTEKLIVLDTPEETVQFTFLSFCKGRQSTRCEPSPMVAIGVLSAYNDLTSTSLIALVDGERLDLGHVSRLQTEAQHGQTFHSLSIILPAASFQRIAKAKMLKLQLGGVLICTFRPSHLQSLRVLAAKLE